jgi:uncharacterized protein (DUF1330 family)
LVTSDPLRIDPGNRPERRAGDRRRPLIHTDWRVMAAYLIYARKEITDEEVSREYSRQAVPQIREFGGEVLTARGATYALEGDWSPHSVTILKFDDRESLMRWYDSPEYAPLKEMRLASNVGDIIVVDNG